MTTLITLCGFIGMWMTGKYNAVGWLVALLSQILWVVYAFYSHDYALLVPAVAYSAVYIYCYRQWTKCGGPSRN